MNGRLIRSTSSGRHGHNRGRTDQMMFSLSSSESTRHSGPGTSTVMRGYEQHQTLKNLQKFNEENPTEPFLRYSYHKPVEDMALEQPYTMKD